MRVLANGLPLLLFPPTGLARYLRCLTSALGRLHPEWRVDLFLPGRILRRSPAPHDRPSPLGRALLAAHHRLPIAGLERAWIERAFRAAVRPRDVDLYHETHFAPLSFHGPTVLTVYDLSLRLLPETQPRRRVALFERTFPSSLPGVARFLAISESVKRDLCAHFPVEPERVTVTPLGVDSAVFHPAPGADGDPSGGALSDDDPSDRDPPPCRYLLAVGTLEPRKDAPTLIAAYARLPRALRAAAPLVWAGPPGWSSIPLERLARAHGVKEDVLPLGYVDDARLAQLYRGATAFLFPTRYEGFGLPALEAMACGVPVVCSDAEAVLEVVDGAALVVPTADVAAWSAALRRILEDEPLRARLRAAGPGRARGFTWERCAALTADAYAVALEAGT